MSQTIMSLSAAANESAEPRNLNRNRRSIRFIIARRSLESKLERILRAAYGHESNGVRPGDYEYEVLNAEAEAVCKDFANRWGLDVDLLKAYIPGLAKLDALASLPAERDYIGVARVTAIAIPIAFFLMGCVAGLFSLGFHLMGGR